MNCEQNSCTGKVTASGLLSASLRLKPFEACWKQLGAEVCLNSRDLCIALQEPGKRAFMERKSFQGSEFLAQFHRPISFVCATLKMSEGN